MRNLFALVLVVVLAGCGNQSSDRKAEAIPVVAQPVQRLSEQLEIEAIGTARAAVSAELYPEAAGTVRQVRFSGGDYVRSGQPLLQLDARRERLAVDLARVKVREASQLLARYRRIEDTGALSESQIEAGETALAAAQVELEQAQLVLSDRTVRAPFAGHIGLTEIDRGDRVTLSTPIAQLDNRRKLLVDFPAPEAVFNRLRAGQIVTVVPFSDPDRAIEARVGKIDSTVSEERRSYTVRTAIDNSDDRLRPGMSFRVTFSGVGKTYPSAPEEAVVWGGKGAYLWAVRDGQAERLPVTIVSRRNGLVLVDGNLRAKEVVVVEGVHKIREGQKLRLVKPATAKPQDARLESEAKLTGNGGG